MTTIWLLVALAQTVASSAWLPNPKLTPGATMPVTVEQLCTPGYAKTVRDVSTADKQAVFHRYAVADVREPQTTKTGRTALRSDFEVDHLIPLALGGSNAIENLWIQSETTEPWNAKAKDRLETQLHRMVCAGQVNLRDAQHAMATDWVAAYQKYVSTSAVPVAGGTSTQTVPTEPQQDAARAGPVTERATSPVSAPVQTTSAQRPEPTGVGGTAQRGEPQSSSGEERMGEFFVFAELPWLRRVLAYVIGLGALWLALAVAGVLLAPVVRRLRAAYREFLVAFAARQDQQRLRRSGAVDDELDQLRNAPHLRQVLRRGNESPLESDEVAGAFSPLVSAVRGARDVLETSQASFDGLQNALVQNGIVAKEFVTSIPSAAEIQAAHNTKMREVVHLLVGGTIVAAVIFVNTGMLSQILKGLGFVPRQIEVLGVPLYALLALLLTLVETATGVFFGWTQHRVRRDSPASRIAPVFAVALALGMATVEGTFYSRVGSSSSSSVTPAAVVSEMASGPCTPSDDIICLPGIDAPVRFSSVMFLWGFVLVMTMFGAATMVHNASTELTEDVGLSALRRRLTKASKTSADVKTALRLAEQQQDALLAKTKQIVETFTSSFALNGSPDMLVTMLAERLMTGAIPVPTPDDRFSHAEVRELEWRAVLWWWIAVATTITCAMTVPVLFTTRASAGVGSAIIFVLLAVAVGFDLSKQDVVAGLTAQAERIGRRLFLRRAVRAVAVLALVALGAVILLRPSIVGNLLPWVTLAATAVVLVLAGRELVPWFTLVVVHLRRLVNVVIWLTGRLAWFVLAVFYGIIVLLDAVVDIVAAPISFFFQRRTQTQ